MASPIRVSEHEEVEEEKIAYPSISISTHEDEPVLSRCDFQDEDRFDVSLETRWKSTLRELG